MTSWTDEQLNLLCDPENHRIHFDGYDYIWEHKLGKKWEKHSILEFSDHSTPYSWLCYWLAVWNNELMSRRRKKMQKERRVQRKINKIHREFELSTSQKVQEIAKLKPELSSQDISNILDVSVQLVRRYLKTNK